MLGDKASLNKFKEVEITSSIFYDHNGLKLGNNYNYKTNIHKYVKVKYHAMVRPMDK